MRRLSPVAVSLGLHAAAAGLLAGWGLLAPGPGPRPVPEIVAQAPVAAPEVEMEAEAAPPRPVAPAEPEPELRPVAWRLPPLPDPVPAEHQRTDPARELRRAWRGELPAVEKPVEPVSAPPPAEPPPAAREAPSPSAKPRVQVLAPRLRPGQAITEADYPRLARRKGWEGLVVLRVEVAADGRVREAEVLQGSGHEILDEAALRAVRGWSFQPALEDGRPVAGETLLRVRFRLRSPAAVRG